VRSGTSADSIIECADSIVQNVDSIAKLASEFSTFARMPTIEVKPTSLNQLCKEVLSSYRTSRIEIMYHEDLDESVPTMWLDPDQIKRALVNLLENSIDAVTLAKVINPQVSVVTKHDAKSHNVTVEVSDNGLGIPAANKTRIFDPYFTTKTEGTGIGLGIVLSIVVDHGGTIRVFDNVPSGAKFVMTFPTQSSTQRKLAT
jgi:two-component system nitrogen regulation sensor histidine kinase NtrY